MAAGPINFTRGVPPAEVFPVDDLVRAAEAALRSDAAVLLQYGRSPGYAPLRTLLGGWYGVGPEQVLVGNSSLEIVEFMSRLWLGAGKRVFVELPSYDRAITLFRRAGAEVVGIPLEEDGVNIPALEAELRRGVPVFFYTITDFQNPMGTTTSEAKRREIARLAGQYGFTIIEDAPYRALRYWGQEAPTIRSMAPGHVIHLSSFSKTLAPGLRLGYAIAAPEAVAELAEYATNTYIGPVYPAQGLVHQYLKAGLLEANIEKLKALYAPRLRATLDALAACMPQASWPRPEGGFFVGITLPEGASMTRLLPLAEREGLKLSDGRGFYPAPEDGDRFLRIPFCSVTPEDIHRGIARIASLM